MPDFTIVRDSDGLRSGHHVPRFAELSPAQRRELTGDLVVQYWRGDYEHPAG